MDTNKTSTTKPAPRPYGVAAVVFALALIASALVIGRLEQRRMDEARAAVREVTTDRATDIEQALDRSFSATFALATLVQQGHGKVKDFESVATKMLAYYPGVSVLILAPDGVITDAVPRAGNERAIGLNLLTDPVMRREAELARQTGKLTLAGPVELRQGGLGLIARLPIFLEHDGEPDAFWGFTNVVLRFPTALAAANLPLLAERGLSYRLWRVNPDTQLQQVIMESAPEPLEHPVQKTLAVPNGAWTLSVAPTGGWSDPVGVFVKGTLGLVLSLLLGYLAKLQMRQFASKAMLEREVQARTAEIRASQRQLSATLEAIPDLLFEMDLEGRYLSCHVPRNAVLADPIDQLLGRTVSEVLSQANAQMILTALQEAHVHEFSFGHQIELALADGTRCFELSIARKPSAVPPQFIVISHDITQAKQVQKELQLAASVFTHAREGIMITDPDGTIVEVNGTFSEITGYSRAESLGQTPRMLKSGRQPAEFYAAMWRELEHSGHWSGEVWNRRKNGELYAQMLTVSAVRNAEGRTLQYVSLFSDITSAKEHQRQLEHVAHYDVLTNLPNRLLLADRLKQAMLHAQRRNSMLAVVYLDLDGFKAVNDRHGHNVGDELLATLSHRMHDALRDGDTLARIGGDEFVAVLTDLQSPADCEPLLTRLLQAAASKAVLHSHNHLVETQVSASAGVTLFPQDDADADLLLRHADQAMYQAKQSGKNRYHLFDLAHDTAIKTRNESLDHVRRALEQHEFLLYYQPKVNMRTGSVVGAEALLRWQHPERGLLSPGSFLGVVEDDAISIEMGEWVIRTALTQMRAWRAQGLDLAISVNIGARQLQSECFDTRLKSLLEAYPDVPAHNLQLEVLETSALEDLSQVGTAIHTCCEMGVSFALDDFGTGYSSLTYLKHLPAQTLKIDQSFVRDMLDDSNDLAIVDGVIGLARAFGRDVLAEGVETEAHGQMLLSLGCDLAQGYGIARPMAPEALARWVADWTPGRIRWLA